eukprot:gene6521-7551_t
MIVSTLVPHIENLVQLINNTIAQLTDKFMNAQPAATTTTAASSQAPGAAAASAARQYVSDSVDKKNS